MNIELYDAMSAPNPPMPELYNKAKLILVACTQIDECKEWADKMAALGSYAKQAGDDELEKLARRIRGQAIRRCGELLRQLDGRPDNYQRQTVDNYSLPITQGDAALKAKMSPHQQAQAVRIANVDNELFNTLIDSDTPPTITTLAELGKKKRAPLANESAFAPAIHFNGALTDLYKHYLNDKEPQYYLDGMEDWQQERARNIVPKVMAWLEDYMQLLT